MGMGASVLDELGARVPRRELEREIADGLTPDRFADSAWDFAGLLLENLEIDASELDAAAGLILRAYRDIWEGRA